MILRKQRIYGGGSELEQLLKPRVPKNTSESAFCSLASDKRWIATKRGWPDFFCVQPDGKIAVVEVKKSPDHALRTQQVYVMRSLAAAGIACYTYSPQGGLRPFVFHNSDTPPKRKPPWVEDIE